ncbi:Membrane protein [Streptococcus pneumoniae]|nr:Membrane protein [Streptococcus pneumoniae]
MELVLPNNYVVIDEEEMMYLDGGAYLSKRACQGICAALAMSPGTFIALAGAAVLTKNILKLEALEVGLLVQQQVYWLGRQEE